MAGVVCPDAAPDPGTRSILPAVSVPFTLALATVLPFLPLATGGVSLLLPAGGPFLPLLAGGASLLLPAGGASLPLLDSGTSLPLLAGGISLSLLAGGASLPLLAGGASFPLLTGVPFLPLLAGGPFLPLAGGAGTLAVLTGASLEPLTHAVAAETTVAVNWVAEVLAWVLPTLARSVLRSQRSILWQKVKREMQRNFGELLHPVSEEFLKAETLNSQKRRLGYVGRRIGY
ncbi:hypothetical protein NDU88_004989 [Pleurodeles waltl]|uniref:Uncharacterized protein n=1 Tax=Pleurodeles waltl TaxID=8319 RepID=A0AAV7PE28_PLEWA|nr:hypothetical protein NDU88_004989 [Pleurodeles waltl]